MIMLTLLLLFFFFNDTATTEIYTLSLHDALPICSREAALTRPSPIGPGQAGGKEAAIMFGAKSKQLVGLDIGSRDRKSTRLNSSHGYISYAVFCLQKKKKHAEPP